jgi:hypothetical protein
MCGADSWNYECQATLWRAPFLHSVCSRRNGGHVVNTWFTENKSTWIGLSLYMLISGTAFEVLISLIDQILDRSRSYFTTDGQSVSLSWCRGHSGTCDQILLPVRRLLSESCGLVCMERPLWQEDVSADCSAFTQWSESLRTRNHSHLSHLRLFQPGGPGSHICIPQEQGGLDIPLGTVLILDNFKRHPVCIGTVFHKQLTRRCRLEIFLNISDGHVILYVLCVV